MPVINKVKNYTSSSFSLYFDVSNIHYRQKIWNIFYFSDILHFLWDVQGIFVFEIHYSEQILLLGELIST